MVIDAIGAFALACNILQAIEYGSKILTTAVALGTAESGLLVEHKTLESIAKDLLSITKSLQNAVGSSRPGDTLHAQLQNACKECIHLSIEFTSFFDSHKLKGNPSVWRRLITAMKLAWRKDHMISMQSALATAQSNLQLAFLIHSHSRLESMISNSTSTLEQTMAETVKRVLDENPTHPLQVSKLAETLARLRIDNDDAFARAAAELLRQCRQDLDRLAAACADVASNANTLRSTAYSTVVPFVRYQILSNLYFAELYDRYEHISKPHKSTFSWALSTETSPPTSAENGASLMHWLSSKPANQTVYWISGKPGSGKSTLLRQLGESLPHAADKQTTFEGCDLLVVKIFFWKPGKPIQHSLEGFLRSFLFQLLSRYPDHIDRVVPKQKWDYHMNLAEATYNVSHPSQSTFSLSNRGMEEAVHQVLALLTQSNIVLLLDGLDELGKTNADRVEFLDFLDTLKQYKYVKMICSSRPWVIFTDWFSESAQLRLEDLTKHDIQQYVEDKLTDNPHFQRSCLGNSKLPKRLISDILERAHGVFLWVYLVVRELVTGAQHGESIRGLRVRFDAIPPDLNEYFQKIMKSIEPRYVREASALFQIQLAYIASSDTNSLLSEEPRLLEMSFLDLDCLDFAWAEDFVADFSINSPDDRVIMEELMERRINSRCMGLLEVQRSRHISRMNQLNDQSQSPSFGQRIEFFHRSFSDFLEDEAQDVLYEHTNGKFDVGLFRLNAYLSMFESLEPSTLIDFAVSNEKTWFRILYDIGICANQHPHLCDVFAGLITEIFNKFAGPSFTPLHISSGLDYVIHQWQSLRGSFIAEIAISYGWNVWVERHLTSAQVKGKNGKPYLHYCVHLADDDLVPYPWSCHYHPNSSLLVRTLLRKGADVRRVYDGHSVLSMMLKQLLSSRPGRNEQTEWVIRRKTALEMTKEMLMFGLSHSVPARRLLPRHSATDGGGHLNGILSDQMAHDSVAPSEHEIFDRIISQNRTTHFEVCKSWPLAELTSRADFSEEPTYSLTSLLACLDFPPSDLQAIQKIIDERNSNDLDACVGKTGSTGAQPDLDAHLPSQTTDRKRMFDTQLDTAPVTESKRARRKSL